MGQRTLRCIQLREIARITEKLTASQVRREAYSEMFHGNTGRAVYNVMRGVYSHTRLTEERHKADGHKYRENAVTGCVAHGGHGARFEHFSSVTAV
jgi:hypothetical protein